MSRSFSLTLLALWLPLTGCRDKDTRPVGPEDSAPLPSCEPGAVPEEATLRSGWQDDGTFISPGGRLVAPAGTTLTVEGMPSDVAIHPRGHVAYVTITATDDRAILVLDLASMAILQTLPRSEAHLGLEIAPDGDVLYAAGGALAVVDAYAIASDGTLSAAASIPVTGTANGLALSSDGRTLWVGSYDEAHITEISTQTLAVIREIPLSTDVWDIVYVPGRDELYASDLKSDSIMVVDLDSGTEASVLSVATAPAGLAVHPEGHTVYAAVSNGDRVVAIDTDTRSITAEGRVAEEDLLDAQGLPLPNSNVTAVWLDADGERLFAARGADNAISVLDPSSLERLGAFPTALYPIDLERTPDNALLVAEYKGGGIGPGGSAKEAQRGSVTLVDLNDIDLVATTEEVSRLYASPLERFPYPCDASTRFPVPEAYDGGSPIEHVVLIVKENKTLDCLFGDMDSELPELNVDAKNLRWPAELTPNQRALIRQFNISDNFYVDALDSDAGHLMLTSTHLTHYAEWMWMETVRNSASVTWPVSEPAFPSVGNFFTHVVNHGKTLRVYGEVVGMFAQAQDGTPIIEFSDTDYPGGGIVNYAVTDEEKATHVAERIAAGDLAHFTYLLLPNDHTNGTSPGTPTPESMVADNDYAVGIVVEALSKADTWEKTAIFIVQDDPQGCSDHVDASRSFILVVSPYARHGGYVSHANGNFLSIFATTERLLGIPPIGRPDAVAVPLWDMFQATPDLTPFTAIPRLYPAEENRRSALGAEASQQMDFSGPDRSPGLTPLLDAYMLYRMGRISREEAEARLRAPRLGASEDSWEELAEEAEEESYAYDRDYERYRAWIAQKGKPVPPPLRPAPEDGKEEDDD